MKCDVCKKVALNRDLMHDINLCNEHAFQVEEGILKLSDIKPKNMEIRISENGTIWVATKDKNPCKDCGMYDWHDGSCPERRLRLTELVGHLNKEIILKNPKLVQNTIVYQ